jgi:hypothetical protein
MNRRVATVTAAVVVALAVATGAFAIFRSAVLSKVRDKPGDPSAWTEVAWPFPVDQWGSGKAFKCKPAGCDGADVNLYIRAKLGSCNCATGVASDEDLDRMSDFDLVSGEVSPLAPGRSVRIGEMNGRVRAYALTDPGPGASLISVVFNDRCDMVVATVVLARDQPTTIERAVIEFLNSAPLLHWTELALGL